MVDAVQPPRDPDVLLGLARSVEGPVGGQDEQQVPHVPAEVLLAQELGQAAVEVGPHAHIDVLPVGVEHVRQQLRPAAPVHYSEGIGLLVVGDCLGFGFHVLYLGAQVPHIHEGLVELQDN